MKFSVLIPVFNVEKYLKTCIISVLNQTYEDFEIIIIDDGSTDRSGIICDEFGKMYPTKINVIHKKNEGLLAARRDGFSLATGDYCICLDSDDFLEINALEELSKIIDNTEPDFIIYDLMYYHETTQTFVRQQNNMLEPNILYSDTSILKEALLNLSQNNWSMCAKCIKREITSASFNYKDYYDVSFGEDSLQTIILYNVANTFIYSKAHIYNYRVGSGMTQKLPIKYLDDFHKIKELINNVCVSWDNDIATKSDVYWSHIVLLFLNNVCYSSDTYSELKIRISEIRNKYDFCYILKTNKLDTLDLKMKIRKILFQHNVFCVSYFKASITRLIRG